MVRPWTPDFSTNQTQPNNLLVWVCLPGLPERIYNTSLLKFIGGVIGSVAKIDRITDSKARGKCARLAVFVDLGQLLISKIKIDDQIVWSINPYRWCVLTVEDVDQLSKETSGVPKYVEEERYGPWMLVERRQKKGVKAVLEKTCRATVVGERNRSRFESLSGDSGDNSEEFGERLAKEQAAGKLNTRNMIRVMNEIIHGIHSYNGENSRLMDDEMEDGGSSNESLADAEEA
ncbi:hypothetical protein PVK06_023483 [Gossypium arboreum]|uniref:DUF4283 domain-containing protein n=1 Tax=Gossypium arboreum TaxID=29729 RepID=A0ABR0PBA2_GOSAR|nr:hypothetical protein PVK06_023483 [Gossypium arboreum]